VLWFFLSLIIGVLVAATLVIVLKQLSHTDAEEITATA
jgi:hypothetical protein